MAKTKFVIFNRTTSRYKQIEKVEGLTFLESIITQELDPDGEIESRIEMAPATFSKLRSILCDNNLNVKLRQQLTECFVII